MSASCVEKDVAQSRQYLTFLLNGQEFGIDILQVQEIKNFSRITPIPNSPESILGVINLRGTVIPIVDLRKSFQMPDASYDAFTVIIVVNIREKVVGLVVDAVSDVLDVDVDAIESPDVIHGDQTSTVISGIAKSGDSLITIMEISNLIPADLSV